MVLVLEVPSYDLYSSMIAIHPYISNVDHVSISFEHHLDSRALVDANPSTTYLTCLRVCCLSLQVDEAMQQAVRLEGEQWSNHRSWISSLNQSIRPVPETVWVFGRRSVDWNT